MLAGTLSDAHHAQASAPVKETRGPARYIGQLLVAAKERERESDVVFERRTVKERQKEDHLFGDKEKFVTAAYKAKLAEDAKWLEKEKARDEAEAAADVTKRKDMSAFYANLLNKNAAFGGQPEAAAPAPAPARAEPVAEEARHVREERAVSPAHAQQAPAAPQEAPALAPPQQPAAAGAVLHHVSSGPVEPHVDATAAAAAAAAQAVAAAILPAAKRERATEDAVMSARERYLARKKQKVEEGDGA